MDGNILLKEQNQSITAYTPNKNLGSTPHIPNTRLSPAVAYVRGFCKANGNIWKDQYISTKEP